MANHVTELVAGFLLLAAGIFSLVRKRFAFGLFGGKSGLAGPIFTIRLSGGRASAFGAVCIVAAAVILLPWFYVYITNNTAAAKDLTIPVIAFLGIAVAISGLIASAFFELLEHVRKKAESNKDN